MLELIAPFMPIVNKLVGLIPDKNAREVAKEEFTSAFLAAYVEQMRQQAEINKVEAASSIFFVAGWRPFIGWVCGLGFAYTFLVLPIVNGILTLFGVQEVLPGLDNNVLMELTLGMLGMAGLRSFEKMKGVAR